MRPIFQLSTIWAETADNARSAARTFVLGGLSDKHHGVSNVWVADRINVIVSLYTVPLENNFKLVPACVRGKIRTGLCF